MSTVSLPAYEIPPEFDDFRAAIGELVRARVSPRAREIDGRTRSSASSSRGP